jgi:hypothetical protein
MDDELPAAEGDLSPNQMETRLVDIDLLVLDEKNARKGSVPDIVASLRELGQHRPIVVQKSSNKVIAGNHTVMAAQVLGWKQINAVFVDDDDKTAIRRSLADNFTGQKGGWDDDVLRELLTEVGDTSIPGLDDKAVEKLLAATIEKETATPSFPIVANIGEKYDYVLVVATNEIDSAWLHERFKLRREASYKSKNVGLSRVVTVPRLRVEWDELPDLNDVQAHPNEDDDAEQ